MARRDARKHEQEILYAEWLAAQRGIPVDQAWAHARHAPSFPLDEPRGRKLSPPNGSDANGFCSFCGKSQHEVRKLIAGPTVFICDECVELCSEMIR
jgi:hypothetical protein